MRKGFLHDRLGSAGRSCRGSTGRQALTSREGQAGVTGGFAGQIWIPVCGQVWATGSMRVVEPRLRGAPGWQPGGQRGGRRGPRGERFGGHACCPLCWGSPRRRAPRVTAAAAVTGPHRLVAQDTALSRRRHGFESRWGHRRPVAGTDGPVEQLVSSPPCQGGGRGFKSRQDRLAQTARGGW